MEFNELKKLFEGIYLLNRTHNSDGLVKAIQLINIFMKKKKFRGSFKILEYPSNKEFNYWKIPGRWKVKKFLLKSKSGKKIATLKSHPLVLTPFSNSFKGKLTLNQLKKKIITRKDMPNAIPFHFRKMFRNWNNDWNIALPFNVVKKLNEKEYFVEIETEFQKKPMPLLEYTIKGKKKDTINLTSHLDHAGQCNDSLSGVISSIAAIYNLEKKFPKTNYTYTMLFCPEIIGSAAYVNYEKKISNVKYALCPNLLNHNAPLAISKSKSNNSLLDKALHLSVMELGYKHVVGPWHEYSDSGDEISYDAPGVDIPTTCISRIGELFKFYHTSLDTPDKIIPSKFMESVKVIFNALKFIELNYYPQRTFKGNPSLANPKLDLYLEPLNVSNKKNKNANFGLINLKNKEVLDPRNFQEYFLSNIEGDKDLITISYETNISFSYIYKYSNLFLDKKLIKKNMNKTKLNKDTKKIISLTRPHKLIRNF